jgi:hypothetical protein
MKTKVDACLNCAHCDDKTFSAPACRAFSTYQEDINYYTGKNDRYIKIWTLCREVRKSMRCDRFRKKTWVDIIKGLFIS